VFASLWLSQECTFRAKLELREIVEVQDAQVSFITNNGASHFKTFVILQDAIDIMKESLYDVFANDRGNVDSSKRFPRRIITKPVVLHF